MKKILFSAAMLILSAGAALAQENKEEQKPTFEQRAERISQVMADKLLLDDATTKKFVPLYQEYIVTLKNVNTKYKPEKPVLKEGEKPAPKTDKEIDAQIRNEFEKSQEILDTRRAYYEKFLKVLTPKQIREMYKLEREKGEAARSRKESRGNEPHHQGPGENTAPNQPAPHQPAPAEAR